MRFIHTGIMLLAVLAEGCGSGTHPAEPKRSFAGYLRLASEESTLIQVVHPAREFSEELTYVGGRIDFDPNLVTKISSPVSGTILQVEVNQGSVVHRGQPLARIFSSDFAGAVSDYQKAAAQVKTTTRNLARARELADAKILSQRELQQAAADSAQAAAEFNRAGRVLRMLNGSGAGDTSEFVIRAPIDGMVLERSAQIGAQVHPDNTQSLFTIGRTGTVWAILDLYQDDLARVAPGDTATLRCDGTEDTALTAVIRYISPVIDQSTLTAKARCEIANPNGTIRPAMFCSASVRHRIGTSLFLPAAAAFAGEDGRTYVFVKVDSNGFIRKEIRPGRVSPDRIEVLQGVDPADAVVANGAIFLNEELQLSSR